jgi:hypothetical protein
MSKGALWEQVAGSCEGTRPFLAVGKEIQSIGFEGESLTGPDDVESRFPLDTSP